MSPTPEVSERQRQAAYKAWETIRRKKVEAGDAETKSGAKPKIQAGVPAKSLTRKKWNPADYPANWRNIVAEIRSRSRNLQGKEQCECEGECRTHKGRCDEINGEWPKHRRRKGKVTIRLTIAHLCHTPKCDDRSHLRAMCEPCHLIYDLRCRQQRLLGEAAIKWAIQRRASLGNQRDNSRGTGRSR
jgi:hypothetical protein